MTIAIALLASLAWGGADFLGGALSRRFSAVKVAAGSQVVGLVVLGVLTAVSRPALPGQAAVLAGVAAGACSFVGLTLMYRALAIGKMAVVAPIIGSSAAVPVIWGLLQGDQLTPSQLVGIAVCLTGILVVTRGSRDGGESPSGQGARSGPGPIALAVISAVVFGASLVFLSHGSDEAPLMTTVVMRAAACVVAVPVVLLSRAPRLVERRGFAPVLAIGVLDSGAYLAFSWASSVAQLAVVSTLSALYPVVTAVLAFFLHGERLSRWQLGGVALTLGGIVAIAL